MNTGKFIEYLETEKGYSPNTILAYKADINQFAACAEREFGVTDEKDVTAPMIRIWLVELKDRGVSNRSIGRKVAGLRTYFNFMARIGALNQNPMLKVAAPKVLSSHPNVVLTDEMERILSERRADTSFPGVRNTLILELLYATGMRQAELLEVEEDDIDYEAQEIRVQGKGRKERIVPISPVLLERVKRYIEEKRKYNNVTKKLLINNKFEPMSKKQLYSMVCKEMETINSTIQHSPHVLRHTFATSILSEGADLNSVKEIMGHSSIASTQVYTHTTIEELKKAYKQAHPRAEVAESKTQKKTKTDNGE